jgi:hypothetical protein
MEVTSWTETQKGGHMLTISVCCLVYKQTKFCRQLTTQNMLAKSALVRCRIIFCLISQPLQIYALKTENNLVYQIHPKYRD